MVLKENLEDSEHNFAFIEKEESPTRRMTKNGKKKFLTKMRPSSIH